MAKTRIAALGAALAFLLLSGPAAAFSRQDVTIVSFDGTPIAATLFLPDGAAPAGGWPAVVFMHGLGGDRASMNALAQTMGVAGEQYAVLTFDARGHGASGGLISIDGPREIADVRAVFDWLAARSDVADAKIGAWGISLGGGAVWNSLAAGVPWAAVEIAESWTSLQSALVPQGLAKSGVIAGFLGALPPQRVDPALFAVRNAAYAGELSAIGPFAAPRSSLSALAGNRTPVFMMQGRRDFAFGMGQALQAWKALAGPKRLWLGLHGHAPSSFPAADTGAMLAEGKHWFDRYLRGEANGIDASQPVALAPESWSGQPVRFDAPPRPVTQVVRLPGATAIAQSGKVQRTSAPLRKPLEVFGAPTVRVRVVPTSGWTRLVAVLSARTPAGKEIVIGGGGVPTAPGMTTVTAYLSNQATFVPAGSRLTLTLGSSSLAQSPGNLLYLDLPLAAGARISLGSATVSIPALKKPVSR